MRDIEVNLKFLLNGAYSHLEKMVYMSLLSMSDEKGNLIISNDRLKKISKGIGYSEQTVRTTLYDLVTLGALTRRKGINSKYKIVNVDKETGFFVG